MKNRTTAKLVLIAVCGALLRVAGVAEAQTTHQVQVGPGLTFSPAMLTIQEGDSVTWTNAGGFHNVRADDDSFECAIDCAGSSDPSSTAWQATVTFDAAGTVPYYCEAHGNVNGVGMSGVIAVEGGGGGNPGTIQMSATTLNVNENGGAVNVGVERVGGDDGAVSVSFSTANGTALAGFDYTAASGTLSWPDNDDDPRVISIPIVNDSEDEGPESFTVNLSNPTGGANLGSGTTTVTIADDDDTGPPPPVCVQDGDTLCFLEGRFAAEVVFTRPGGTPEAASAVPFTDRAGLFYFFNEANLEMLIKMQDACSFNNRFWVFYAATTNVEFTVTVTDTAAGTSVSYDNPQGMAALPIQDTSAFGTCP